MIPKPKEDYTVVWSGRGELLPSRSERVDGRFNTMPTFDLDDDEYRPEKAKRKYTKTGKHKGKFSRTDPSAAQYKPTLN